MHAASPSRPLRLRSQLLLWVLPPLVGLLIIDAVLSLGVASRFAQTGYDKSLEEVARELALQIRVDASGALVLDLPEPTLRVLLQDEKDTLDFELIDRTGRRVAGRHIAQPPQGAAPTGRASFYDAQHEGQAVRVVQWVVADHGAVIRVTETRNKRNELAQQIMMAVILPQVLLILMAAILVILGVRQGLRPLERLARALSRSSPLQREPLDGHQVPGEVRPLVVAINQLLERQDQILKLQSRFIADAAHQLKTPVAGLKAQMELLARQPEAADQRRIIGHLYVGIERMSRLVSQLLSLARNEPEAVNATSFQLLDLNQLVLDAALVWAPQALKRRIDLGFEGVDQPVMLQGDPQRLRELFDNLLDNAIRYSQESGKVTVRVQSQPSPRVSISDDGPLIPTQERQRIFERFHRLAGSSEGSGLGLAIANEIAGVHGARITLDEDAHDGVGNTFSVVFPPYQSAGPMA